MDFNTTIDIIIKDLREIREIVDDLRKYPGVPKLQIELAKSKCRSAEEIIALLKNYMPEDNEMKVKESASMESVKSHAESLIEISDEEMNDDIHEPPAVENGPIIRDSGSPEQPGEKSKDKKVETTIFADKFTGISGTVFDKFESIKKEDDISSVINTRPVGDLSDAIGVNDKFLFIREIFSGSQSAYELAIGRLNMAENLSDAKAIIMSYTGEENDVVKQLLEIVKRKLPSDG